MEILPIQEHICCDGERAIFRPLEEVKKFFSERHEPCEHTPQPERYCAWHEWADEKAKTHRQIRCLGCGLFKVWIPKTPSNKQEGLSRG